MSKTKGKVLNTYGVMRSFDLDNKALMFYFKDTPHIRGESPLELYLITKRMVKCMVGEIEDE